MISWFQYEIFYQNLNIHNLGRQEFFGLPWHKYFQLVIAPHEYYQSTHPIIYLTSHECYILLYNITELPHSMKAILCASTLRTPRWQYSIMIDIHQNQSHINIIISYSKTVDAQLENPFHRRQTSHVHLHI